MKTLKAPKLQVRFGMIVAAIVLLCNPNINLFDIMPDFVAYLLLSLALTYACAANPYFSQAREGFKKLMWLSLTKFPALILMMMIRGGDSSQKSIVAVFALCYAVIDIIVAYPAFTAFFEGLFYLRDRHGCAIIDSNSSLPKPEFLKTLTLAFIITKSVLSTLPELALISVKEYNPTPTGSSLVISRYYPLFAAIGAVICLIFGVIWASQLIRYVRHISQTDEINSVCEQTYRSYYSDIYAKQKQSYITNGLVAFAVGVGLGLDLIFDNYNVLPDFLSGILIVVGAWILLPFANKARYTLYTALAYTASATISYALHIAFLDKYTYEMISRKMEAARAYTTLTWSSAVEMLLGVTTLLFVMQTVLEIIFSHSGKVYEDIHKNSSENDTRFSHKKRIVTASVFGVLALVASFMQLVFSGYTKFVALNQSAGASQGYMYIPQFTWFWTVPLILSIIWIALFCSTISDLHKNVQRKYDNL